jgi:hypothetical protein
MTTRRTLPKRSNKGIPPSSAKPVAGRAVGVGSPSSASRVNWAAAVAVIGSSVGKVRNGVEVSVGNTTTNVAVTVGVGSGVSVAVDVGEGDTCAASAVCVAATSVFCKLIFAA